MGDADGAVLGPAQAEGVRQPARHAIKRRRALQPGPAGEFGQGRDETGGITTGEPLRLIGREEQPEWQRGANRRPPPIASAMRRPFSGPAIAVTAIQAMSPSSSADCTKLSRRWLAEVLVSASRGLRVRVGPDRAPASGQRRAQAPRPRVLQSWMIPSR